MLPTTISLQGQRYVLADKRQLVKLRRTFDEAMAHSLGPHYDQIQWLFATPHYTGQYTDYPTSEPSTVHIEGFLAYGVSATEHITMYARKVKGLTGNSSTLYDHDGWEVGSGMNAPLTKPVGVWIEQRLESRAQIMIPLGFHWDGQARMLAKGTKLSERPLPFVTRPTSVMQLLWLTQHPEHLDKYKE